MAKARQKSRGISIADLERAMGKKADEIGDYKFDPESGGWSREIRFTLTDDPTPPPRIDGTTNEER